MNADRKPLDLIALATHPDNNAVSRFSDACAQLDALDLVSGHEAVLKEAPHRHDFDRRYFVGHDGRPSSGALTNRVEEHLAIALVNDQPRWEMSLGRSLDLIDYQVPLKAQRTDRGIGKIDIFGLTEADVPVVIELKTRGKGTPNTPLRAMLEALVYAAIVEANAAAFRAEISALTGRTITGWRPDLLIAAPRDYWDFWTGRSAAVGWEQSCSALCNDLAGELGIEIALVSVGVPELELGLHGRSPRITSGLRIEIVDRWSGRQPSGYSREE